MSEPCSRDKRGIYYFIRDKENAQKVINEKWQQSNGEINYLGEWHTHPEIIPKPSFLDRKLLKECLINNKYPFHGLFMIIVGIEGDLYVGYQTKEMKNLKQLQKIEKR